MAKKDNIIELEDGVVVTIDALPPLAIPSIQQSFKNTFPQPTVPTYTVKTVGGDEIEMEHDETTVETDEEKKEFETYNLDLQAWSRDLNDRYMQLIYLESVHLTIPAKIKKKWDKRLKRLYADYVNWDDDDIKINTIKTFIVKDAEFSNRIQRMALEQTGVSNADLDAAEELFQD